jgi:hypothetical protein
MFQNRNCAYEIVRRSRGLDGGMVGNKAIHDVRGVLFGQAGCTVSTHVQRDQYVRRRSHRRPRTRPASPEWDPGRNARSAEHRDGHCRPRRPVTGTDSTGLDSGRDARSAEQGSGEKPRPNVVRHGLGLRARALQLALQQGRSSCCDLRRSLPYHRRGRRAPDRPGRFCVLPRWNLLRMACHRSDPKGRVSPAHHAASCGILPARVEILSARSDQGPRDRRASQQVTVDPLRSAHMASAEVGRAVPA